MPTYLLMMNESLSKNDESYFDETDEIQDHPFVRTVGIVVGIVYVVVLVFGVPANVFVLCKLCNLARHDREKYMNGTGSGLLAMAAADLLSLLAISLHNILVSITFDANDFVKSFVCKTLLFTAHTVTSVSIWSWLLMSTLRYLAIRHPLFHLRLWPVPYRAIALIVFMSSVTNFWLLIAVDHGESGCVQYPLSNDGNVNRWMHLIECVWSFCIPVAIILYMDAVVLLCRPLEFKQSNGSPLMRNVKSKGKIAKANSALWKWLTIAFIDVLLNTPENLYRLVVLFGMPVPIPDQYNFSARMIAQVLYFAQFAFNAVYLAVFV